MLLKVFQINYRKAEEMEKAVEMLLSPEGRISVDKRTNSLIVKGLSCKHKSSCRFLKEQDKKPQQVKIKISYVDENIKKGWDGYKMAVQGQPLGNREYYEQ